MIKNTEETYGSIAKIFHWTTAILVIALLVLGFFLSELKMPILYKVHKACGFFLLLLMIARLGWRLSNKVPGYDKSVSKLMAFAAHSAHYSLYTLVILLSLSAFFASNAAYRPVSFLFLFDMPSFFAEKNMELASSLMQIHSILAFVLIGGLSLHIMAGLYHHFIRKDNVLKRML